MGKKNQTGIPNLNFQEALFVATFPNRSSIFVTYLETETKIRSAQNRGPLFLK
jgi:hypothetical protein